MSEHCNEETQEDGVIYNLHESLREILSSYNDTLQGRCSVCLEAFAKSQEEVQD